MISCIGMGCNTDRYNSEKKEEGDSTTTAIDTLVSDVSWEEDFNQEEPYYGPSESTTDYASSSSSGGGSTGIPDNDEDVIKYQNYTRDDDTPQEFANALLYTAIRMVYSDNFARPRAKILTSKQEGDRYTLQLRITWKDHWVSKYRMEGTLEVNADGSDAYFVITDKNMETEVLELTEDQFKKEVRLENL